MDLATFQIRSERTMTATLTADELLTNAALGLVEEAAEVIEAAWSKPPTEEAGDALFYAAMLCKALGTSLADLPTIDAPPLVSDKLLLMDAAEIAGIVKKHVFHQQPLQRDRLIARLAMFVARVRRMLSVYDVSLERAMEGNVTKLLKRFPEGFSYAAANARADEVSV